MQAWRRFWMILVLPVIILLDATPERGANWRLTAAVWIVQMLLFLAAIAGFRWLVGPFLALRDRVGAWLALVVFGILGTFLVLAALAAFLHVAVLLCWGRRVVATVAPKTSPSGDPTFQFSDPSGAPHIVSGPTVSATREYGTGQRVPLVYWPGRPQMFVVDRFGDTWGVPLFFFVLGLLILLPWSVFAFDLER
jgi:hypothetical protein